MSPARINGMKSLKDGGRRDRAYATMDPKVEPTENEEGEGVVNENDGIVTLFRICVEC
jgi:hypothetical protein